MDETCPHGYECAKWRGGTDARLDEGDRRLRELSRDVRMLTEQLSKVKVSVAWFAGAGAVLGSVAGILLAWLLTK